MPWEHIQRAADSLIAGDTVFVKAGIYTEKVTPVNSGTPGNHIVYINYPGDTVTIDGASVILPEWAGLFDIQNVSYIIVSGFRIINAGPNYFNTGIMVDLCRNIIIRNNYTYDTESSGIGIWSSVQVIVDSNEIELACNGGDQECLSVGVSDSVEVMFNHVHDGGPGDGSCGGEGIDIKDGSSNVKVYGNYIHHVGKPGIYIDAWDKHTYNIEVYQNFIHDGAEDGISIASEAGGLLENVYLHDNISIFNGCDGVTIANWGTPSPTHPLTKIKIVNNTFYGNGTGGWGGGIFMENPIADSVIIRNNICSNNRTFQLVLESIPPGNVTVDNNLIDGFRGYAGEIYGSDSVVGYPDFADTVAWDFYLLSTSIAIDSGSSVCAPAFDFDGNPRPMGATWDIGAFEYNPGTIIMESHNRPELHSIEAYPNPFNSAVTILLSVIPGLSRSYGSSENPENVEIEIFDICGRQVAEIPAYNFLPYKGAGGVYIWQPDDYIGSGVYLIHLKTSEVTAARRIVYLK